MRSALKILGAVTMLHALLAALLASAESAPNEAEPSAAVELPGQESLNGDRAMGYKRKANVVTTAKPTWRPIQIPKEIQNPAIDVPEDDSAEADELFEKEYYDEYDADLEGTKRHITVFHTFEERMKTYVKMLQKYHAASSPVKGSGKGRTVARKNGGGSRSLGDGRDVEQNNPKAAAKKSATGGAKAPALLGILG